MPRARTGSIIEKDGKIFVRVRWKDELGKVREIKRQAANRTEAQKLRRQMLTESESLAAQQVREDAVHTFNDLAQHYRQEKLKEAVLVEGRKVAGLKSLEDARRNVERLCEHFGAAKLHSIKHHHIRDYKMQKLKEEYAISSVHRELETLRAMLRLAELKGWLARSPFNAGEPLINKADENRRERVLSPGEEARLLQACLEDERRKHLRPLIICALDTAARRGELFKLRWRDVHLEEGYMRLLAENTKTQRARVVPITPRMREALRELPAGAPEALVFGITDTVKRSFATVCRLAKITDLHFHDLRHTGITRMVAAGIPASEVMRICGHTQMVTFLRYLNPTPERIGALGEVLQAYLEGKSETRAR